MSISTITPPLGFVGELILIPDAPWTTDTTGNIKNKNPLGNETIMSRFSQLLITEPIQHQQTGGMSKV